MKSYAPIGLAALLGLSGCASFTPATYTKAVPLYEEKNQQAFAEQKNGEWTTGAPFVSATRFDMNSSWAALGLNGLENITLYSSKPATHADLLVQLKIRERSVNGIRNKILADAHTYVIPADEASLPLGSYIQVNATGMWSGKLTTGAFAGAGYYVAKHSVPQAAIAGAVEAASEVVYDVWIVDRHAYGARLDKVPQQLHKTDTRKIIDFAQDGVHYGLALNCDPKQTGPKAKHPFHPIALRAYWIPQIKPINGAASLSGIELDTQDSRAKNNLWAALAGFFGGEGVKKIWPAEVIEQVPKERAGPGIHP